MSSDELNLIREKIDRIDEQIIALIEQRAHFALEIAQIKKKAQTDPVFYRPEREAAILRSKLASYQGILKQSDLIHILSNIISLCRTLQQQQTIAYIGPEGTYSHAGVLKHFGASVQTTPLYSIEEVFYSVQKNQAHFGLVPIENPSEGILNQPLDLLIESRLHICGEVNLPIKDALSKKIRFIVIGKQQIPPSGHDKTSIVLTTPDTSGALISLIRSFAKQNINITSIESRLYHKRMIDIIGHRDDKTVQLALKKLNELAIVYHVLGSYPVALC